MKEFSSYINGKIHGILLEGTEAEVAQVRSMLGAGTFSDNRCHEIIKGERCGREAGHDGKHVWERGD
jgi:hypothetical protein